jgi:hypothetical protein
LSSALPYTFGLVETWSSQSIDFGVRSRPQKVTLSH